MPLYSYSRIKCFENCPRQYKFKYIEKPPIEEEVGIEAFMGQRVHEALETCYNLFRNGKTLTKEELVRSFENNWEKKKPAALLIVRAELTEESYLAVGRQCLEMYYDRYYPFDQELTIDLERRVLVELDPEGRYKLQGYIDRLARDSAGRLRIHDYKTSTALPTKVDIDADEQLALYQLAIDRSWPDHNGVELVWHYLRHDAELVSRRSREDLEKLSESYINKIRRIEAAVELNNFPTNETTLCNWCEYRSLCPAKGGPGSPGPAAQTTILKLPDTERVAIVDEYIELKEQSKGVNDRLKELAEILTQQGEPGSSSRLHGSKGSVLVSLSSVKKLPTKSQNPGAFEKIEEIMQKAGEYDSYSSLDIGSLQSAYNSKQLPDEVMEKLADFYELSVSRRITVKAASAPKDVDEDREK
jgi:putative RecB family exonuclease